MSGNGKSRAIQLVLLAVGAGVFAELLRTADFDSVAASLAGIGLVFVPLIFAEFLFDALCTLGWRFTLPPGNRQPARCRPLGAGPWVPAPGGCRPGFARLFAIRMAGTSINQVTPTATLGGEPLKAMLLAPDVPLPTGLASVIAAQGSFMIAQAIVIFAGMAALFSPWGGTFPRAELRSPVGSLAIISLVILVAAIWYFIRLQNYGIVPFLSALSRVPTCQHVMDPIIVGARKLDVCLRELYSQRPADFALSVGAHCAARIVSVFQTFLLLHALGVSAGIGACLMIQAASILLDLPSVIVPGRLGLHEGGRMFIFHALKFTTASGLAYALAQRVIQIIMIAIGLLLFARLQIQLAPLQRADCELPL